MSNNLTKEQAEAYFQESGAKCPFCGSYEIEAGETEYDGDYAWRKIECNDCKATWTDEYRLTTVIQKFEDGKENEFENSELIKELAKPATPNYYNLAWNHARKNGLELVSTISKYSVCKKSEDEWCVHTITEACLEHGHYGFDSAGKAGYYALMKTLFDDIRKADTIHINGCSSTDIKLSDDSFYAQAKWQNGCTDDYDFEFADIEDIKNHGVGKWTVQTPKFKSPLTIRCLVLQACGEEL